MSQIFSLRESSYDALAAIINEHNGQLPELVFRCKWTNNEHWEVKLPLNYGNVKVGNSEYVKHWSVETGVDGTVHVKVTGTNKFDEISNGVVFQYRPAAKLMAKTLTTLIQLIRTTNFKIDIRNTKGELIESGAFSPADCLAVRCSI